MSYSAFTKELSDELGVLQSLDPNSVADHVEIAQRRIFDRWILQGRYEGLVRYLVDNYDGMEGGEHWFRLLGEELVKARRPDLIRKLYHPVIRKRRKRYSLERASAHWNFPRPVLELLSRVGPRRAKLARYRDLILGLLQDFRSAVAATPGGDPSDIDREIAAFLRDEEPVQQPIVAVGRKMGRAEFWSLIAEARAIAIEPFSITEIVEGSLATLPPYDIRCFEELMSEFLNQSYTWDLWAVAYAVRHGCGDDEFDYFRAWLILQGRQVYESAIADPIAWALTFEFMEDPQSETLLGAARRAYRARTGVELTSVGVPRRLKPQGQKWSEAEFVVRYPTLASRFRVAQ